jgi:hypothetical protein
MKKFTLVIILAASLFPLVALAKFSVQMSAPVKIQVPNSDDIIKDFIGTSYDGGYLYLMTRNCILMQIDSTTGNLLHQIALGQGSSYCASFAINDQDASPGLVAVRISDSSGSHVIVKAIDTGDLKWQFNIPPNGGMGNDLSSGSFALSWTKDGKYLVSPSLTAGEVEVRSATDGSLFYRRKFPFSELSSDRTNVFFYEGDRLLFEQDAGFYWFNALAGTNPFGVFYTKQTYYDFMVDVVGDELKRVRFTDITCPNGIESYRLIYSTIHLVHNSDIDKFSYDECDWEDPYVQPYLSHNFLLSMNWFHQNDNHMGLIFDADDGLLAGSFSLTDPLVLVQLYRDGNGLILVSRAQYDSGDFMLQKVTKVKNLF